MKRIICLAAVVPLLLSGCGTMPTITKEQACAYATTAYGIYVAVIYAGGEPSKDQIIAAQAAAIVLQTQCGWTPPAVTVPANKAGTRAAFVTKPNQIDGYGVPVLEPR